MWRISRSLTPVPARNCVNTEGRGIRILLILFCSFSLTTAEPDSPPIAISGGTGIILQTQPGKTYDLQESLDLADWDSLSGFPVEGTGDSIHYDITLTDAGTFFRVLEQGPQLLNLPVPEGNLRIHHYGEFEGPRWPAEYGQGHVTLWHEGKFAAYSITIDDNNSPDFPFWMEVSQTYGWKFTWFVIVHPYVWDIYQDQPGTNTGYFGTLGEFRILGDHGHDIQLHGACGEMNTLSAEDYEDHIVRSVKVLEEATGRPVLTFAYPCGKLTSGDGQHDYHGIISRHMIGARGTTGGVTPVHLLDYLNTRSLGVNQLVEGEPGSLFEKVYDNSRSLRYSSYRGWSVTLYHGLSDEAARTRALETFDYVKANEDRFWVAPFTDVAKYAQERESHSLEIRSVEPEHIEFIITDRMRDSLFDHPLTVKFRLSDAWTQVSATQGGQPVASRLLEHEGAVYALVEAVPDRGIVVLTRGADVRD